MRPESSARDAPFPGAHSQVPLIHPKVDAAPSNLPLETRLPRSSIGWGVRLPVRTEVITIEKQLVVVEHVTALRHAIVDRAHLDAKIRKEELLLETEGEPRLAADTDFAED